VAGNPTKIIIELTPKELEILCGSIAHFVPGDKMHEMILFSLYNRLRAKLQEALEG
jgi:hypothetical protein